MLTFMLQFAEVLSASVGPPPAHRRLVVRDAQILQRQTCRRHKYRLGAVVRHLEVMKREVLHREERLVSCLSDLEDVWQLDLRRLADQAADNLLVDPTYEMCEKQWEMVEKWDSVVR